MKATLHWVSAKHAVKAEVRLYDHLFLKEDPDEVADEKLDWKSNLNPDSLKVVTSAMREPALERGNRVIAFSLNDSVISALISTLPLQRLFSIARSH